MRAVEAVFLWYAADSSNIHQLSIVLGVPLGDEKGANVLFRI